MSRLHRLPLACALALGTFGFTALAADGVAVPRGVTANTCVEGICEYTLDNGLRVLLFPDSSKPTVTVNVTYGVGSAHENYGETGMAHLLEHLVFKGTPTHADIPGEMRKRGMSFNGTTSLDRTNYFASFPANDESLSWLLSMEADRMVNSHIARTDLDSEMTVVRNEMESGENSPVGVFFQRMRSSAFHWHNYGNSPIGNRADVENVPIENLQAFYRHWYQPDNATLIIAGRFDSATALAQIQRSFGAIPRPGRSLPVAYTTEPVQDGEREINVRRSGEMNLVGLHYHMPAATHPDTPALQVLADILGNTPNGRLHKALVEPQLAAQTLVMADAGRWPGSFGLIALAPHGGDIGKAEAILLQQVETIAATPVTDEELAQAQRRIANAYEQSFNDVNRVGIALSETVAAGDWRLWFVQRDALAKVTAADVNRVAQRYLVPSNRTLARFIPTAAPVRADTGGAPTVASLVDGYTGRAAVAAGEAFDPSPANLAERTEVLGMGKDLKVSLLPKKTRGERVIVNATFRFNDIEAVKRSPEQAAGMAGAMLMRGSTNASREQVAQRLEEFNATLDVGGGIQHASIALEAPRANLSSVLELAADILRNPAFPESEFQQLRMQMRTGVEAARKEPGTAVSQAMEQHFDPWPSDHPLRFRSLDQTLADLDALTLDDVRAFHRGHYGSSAGELSIVGDFDADEIKPLLTRLFGDWNAPVAYQPIQTRHHEVASEVERFQLADKPNAVYLARLNLPLKDSDPDYEALLTANVILGGGALKSRLGDRVRQRDGLSYGIGSAINADVSREDTDDAGSMTIQAIAASQNMTKVIDAVREELELFVREGVTAEELEDARNYLLVQREQQRANDAHVAGLLNSDQRFGRQMIQREQADERIRALTVEQVNAAIRRFIKPDRFSIYTAGDFDNAPAP
ncbi:MAG: pitrilysin family protein [Pseudoxanthomonas suwonensis]|nr:pitrilysin family protein [Pseudoxanthomonas suwonensis]